MNVRPAAVASVVFAAAISFASVSFAQTVATTPAPASAPAAPAPAAGAPGTAAAPADATQSVVRTEGGRRVYVASGTIEIRGELQRPLAFTLSSRSSLGYNYFDQPVRFVDEILAVVRRGAPF